MHHRAKPDVSFTVCTELEQRVVVIADEVRVKQVLINLATNALKFTKEGFVKMTARVVSSADAAHMTSITEIGRRNSSPLDSNEALVSDQSTGLLYQTYGDSSDIIRACQKNEGGLRATYPPPAASTSSRAGVVLVEVVDSGCGLNPSDFERIFTRFFTKDSGENNLHGFGLGLPISNEIVRASVASPMCQTSLMSFKPTRLTTNARLTVFTYTGPRRNHGPGI